MRTTPILRPVRPRPRRIPALAATLLGAILTGSQAVPAARSSGDPRFSGADWEVAAPRWNPAIARLAGAAGRRVSVDTPGPGGRPAGSPAASKPVAAGETMAPARRVGDWAITRWAGLAVIGDPRSAALHLVFRDENTLRHSRREEGGDWSKPELITASGMQPRLALDRAGTLHLVYCSARAKNPGDRLPDDGYYAQMRDGRWSAPIKLNQPEEGALDVRIAVDGADNVHVIYWAPGTTTREMGDHDRHRCFYRRKPASAGGFEPAMCFTNSVATGPSSHGALAVGPQGEVHVLYRTFQTAPTWAGNLEHRIREKDGAWRGEPAVYRGVYLADHSLSAMVDARGTLYVAGYTFRPQGYRFKCYRKEASSTALQEVFSEAEIYGTSTGIVGSPAGDLWLVGSGNWSLRSRSGKPRSSWYRYDAAGREWSKHFLSAEDTVNVDIFCEGPRLLWHRDQVRVFYAERGADAKFRLFEKILSPLSPGMKAE